MPVAVPPGIEPRILLAAQPVSIRKYCVVVTWLNVCVVVWRHQTRVEDVRFVSTTLDALSQNHPDGVGLIQFIDDRSESVSLPPEARTAITNLLGRGREYIKCSTIIFSGEGFRASAVRAIVTGITWLVRPGFPHKVYARTRDAAEALAAYLAPEGSGKNWSELLVKVVHSARDLNVPMSQSRPGVVLSAAPPRQSSNRPGK